MAAPLLLVPCDPLAPRLPDEHYAREAVTARDTGLSVAVVDHDATVAGDLREALRRVPDSDVERTAWYRGWMLSSSAYSRLGEALEARGLRLLTGPAGYRAAHELPGWYRTFAHLTPASAWVPWEPGRTPTSADVGPLVEALGGGPVGGPGVVKDYVKSRKHEWDEACFVPDLADIKTATHVIARMVELQGDDLAGGIVARAFEHFAPDDGERAQEVRVWWVGGVPVLVTPHPDAAAGGAAEVPAAVLDVVGASVRALGAPFVTTDLALRTDGVWRVIEVGDGQVSDLPGRQEPGALVGALAAVR
ncbi:ATP-grasp domain-containing protein [Promicromonospora sukumoe]